MKILWIVNTIFPYPAQKLNLKINVFGGWLNGLAEKLKESPNIELAIASVYRGKEIKEFNDEKIKYYLIPGAPAIKYDYKMEEYWKIVTDKFKPDLVHIHGTEYAHGLAFRNACPNIKTVLSIQGLITACAKVYYGNIFCKDIIKNITFRDIIKNDNLFQAKKKFEKRGLMEIELIKKMDNVIGRTTWDYANVMAINPNIKYYKGQETLRSSFYQKSWNIKEIEKHSIFCSQASYPIKGIHFAIEAMSIIKKRYPDVKLYIAGANIFSSKLKLSGYGKYIKKLIEKYKLQNNIKFTGLLNEEEMGNQLLKANVFILPSTIENSSNSLGEAMLLGMPCVASNTGGTMDMLKHQEEGMLYPYTEPAMLAEYVSRFFESDELCIKYGQAAKKTASNRHNPEENTKQVIEIYKRILEE